MARKGNQQKNGCDIYSSNNKKGDADSTYGSSRAKGMERSSYVKIISEECLDTDQVRTPLSESVKVTVSSKDSGRKKHKKSGKSQKTGEQGIHAAQSPQHFNHNNSTDGREDSGLRENGLQLNSDNVSACRSSSIHHSFKGPAIEDAVQNMHISCITVIKILKAYGLSILKTSYEWLDRHKPLFIMISNNFLSVRDFVQWKCMQAYPVFLKWLVCFANILLLISMAWLDCALRGMDSFMRMGTTSLFAIIWFSTFSVISMIGMLKFLLVLVVATIIGFFSSLIIALMAITSSGAVILWFYGSFWTTSVIILMGGLAFALAHERIALLIMSLYAVYCAWTYVGWLSVLLSLNLSFISSDAVIYFLKKNLDEQRSSASERMAGMQGQQDFGTESHYSYSEVESSADRSCGSASTSGTESNITSEDEVFRLLNCTDHYAALGFSRYQHVDVSILKREYRKKAMLVHPDKNMGNDKAAEAFKKLHSAYEVLLDSLKRKAYDDELRREDLLNCFRRFQSTSQKSGRPGFFPYGFERSEVDSEDLFGELRRIACKKCGNFHIWIQTKKSKSQARWCQDCKDFHHAKDGDGWVEQSSQPFLFGILQKVEAPAAYVCADSKVYDATEWYICQGMRCPVNSHKPSFHVNTSVTRYTHAKGATSSHRGGMPSSNAEENMTEEELFEWLQTAMQAGMFGNSAGSTSSETPDTRAKSGSRTGATSGGSGGKRKKKGKKW